MKKIFIAIGSFFSRLPQTMKNFIEKLFSEGEENFSRLGMKFINLIRVFIAASRKFLVDDCFTKASAIAYTLIISLIPTLTVVLTFYSIFSGVGDKKDEIFKTISQFLQNNNIKINVEIIFDILNSLIDNAAKIGGIGAAVMVFSATAVLRTVEQSLNDMWKVKKTRSIVTKVIYYWTALSLGPILLIAGSAIGTQVSSLLSSSNYKAAAFSQDKKIWVAGSKGTLAYSDIGNLDFTVLTADRIDFENQEMYEYRSSEKSFENIDFKLEEKEFQKTEFNDIYWINQTAFAVGNNGIILKTSDGGKNWSVSKWGELKFNAVFMQDETRIFLATDNGMILFSEDGGGQWDIRTWENFNYSINAISFNGCRGIAAADRGNVLLTSDCGKTWDVKVLAEAKAKKKPADLLSAFFLNDSEVWLSGTDGVILFSQNGGKTWLDKKYLDPKYRSIFFINKNTGYVLGDNGSIFFTKDRGEKWNKIKLPKNRANQILFERNANGSSLWAIGETGTVMISRDEGKTWSFIHGKSFVLFIFNFFMPFIFIWVLFLMTYIGFPNVKVPFKAAAIGASFTSAVWVIFIFLFSYYVKLFATGTFAVYGTLAAIPIFLLLIYSSALILLYGGEVSYTLAHRHTYLALKKHEAIRVFKPSLFAGIAILYQIYKKFESGKGTSSFKDLEKYSGASDEEAYYFIELFKKNKLILETDTNNYVPALISQNVNLSDIVDQIEGIESSGVIRQDSLRDYLALLFRTIEKNRKEVLNKKTLKNLIDEVKL